MRWRYANTFLLLLPLLACGDGLGPNSGGSAFTFTQAGAGTVLLPSDKAVFVVYSNGNFGSRLYTKPTGKVPGMVFELALDSLPPEAATPTTYDPVNYGPGSIVVGMANANGEKAYPDSGVVTLTRIANNLVQGHVSLRFAFIQFSEIQPPPFRLSGTFTLTKTTTLPPPRP